MNIKENHLQENVTTDPDVLENQFIRWVTNKITGASQLKKVSGLILKIGNILGLQTALDSKVDALSSGFGNLAKIAEAGGIAVSSLKDGVFASLVEMDTLTDTGLYTPSTPISDGLMGSILYVVTGNTAQYILSSKGIWYRQYSTSWSLPMYVGGGNDNIILTYAEAFDLADEDKLTPGVSYTIADYAATGYSLIVLTAATSSSFYQNGYASAPVPAHRFGTFYVGIDTVNFWDVWSSLHTPSIGDVCLWYNKLYVNLTGNIGSTNGYLLDDTNWKLIDPITYREFYSFDVHTVVYDFPNNYVRKEADAFGNEFGDDAEPIDLFQARYNDFGLNIDGGEFYGNKLSRCYNNSSRIGTVVNNTGGGLLFNNKGVIAPGAIAYNKISFGSELRGCSIYDGGRIVENTINGTLYDVLCLSNMVGCTVNASVGHFTVPKDEGDPVLCVFDKDLDRGGNWLIARPPGNQDPLTIDLTKGRIFASYYVSEGVFTLSSGINVDPVVTSGCAINSMSNGVDAPSTSDIEGASTLIIFSGKYEVRYDASAICDTKRDITTYLKVNGVKRQEVWSKKQYTLNDVWVNSSMSNIVELDRMDVLTFGYDVSGTGTATITLGQINVIIKYLG